MLFHYHLRLSRRKNIYKPQSASSPSIIHHSLSVFDARYSVPASMQASTNSSQDLSGAKEIPLRLPDVPPGILKGISLPKTNGLGPLKRMGFEDELPFKDSTMRIFGVDVSFRGRLCFKKRHPFPCAIAKQVVSLYIDCLQTVQYRCKNPGI